ncbi:MAG: signal recognition particle-docking protein FtsY [Phycisphaerales bacterium]|nr:signal recognition particle-docking protein FtsY [Phycisphaerales bacterium]
MGFFGKVISKFKQGLEKTRDVLVTGVSGVKNLLLGRRLDEEMIVELEKLLLQADVGVVGTGRLIDGIRADFRAGTMSRGEDVIEYMKRELKAMWPEQDRRLTSASSGPTVVLVTGINGAGKTTSIAKLCWMLRQQNKRVLLAACDTFRAGAVRQLEVWSERLGVDVIKGQQGGDPAAVAFDACKAAVSRGADVLIVDTAGRLHTQDPLMRQLTKIRSVIAKQIPGAPHETLLVLDATSGQNALRQADEFAKALAAASEPGVVGPGAITGIFLAKLDGTAKGGIVVAIREVTNIPVKFVGLGETPEDIEAFDPEAFVDALFAA